MRKLCLLLLLFLISCDNDGRVANYRYETREVFVPSEETQSKVSELVSGIEFIKLNDSLPESHFSQLDKLVITDDRLYIFELRGNNRVLVFDKNGNFLHNVGRRGRGPGEYQMLRNFTVYDERVLLLNRQGNQMLYYDLEGNHTTTKEMPFKAEDVAVLENGNMLFMLDKDDWDDKKIILTDENFNLLETKLTYSDNDLGDFMWMSNFSQNENEIIFAHPICDTVYMFDSTDGTINSALHMDFGNLKVPDDLRDSYIKIFEARRYSYMHSVPVAVGDYLVGNMAANAWRMTYAVNRKTGEVVIDRFSEREQFSVKSVNLPLAESNGAVATILNYNHIGEEAFEKNNLPKDVCEFISSGGYVVCLIRM